MAKAPPSAAPRLPDRHTVYLSNTAWKKLKERAILEDSSATALVAYLVDAFLNRPANYLPLSRYQARLAEDATEQRKPRTVYMPDPTWGAITAFCEQHRYSVSGVIEYILMQYLGLLPHDPVPVKSPTVIRERPDQPAPPLIIDPGDNPFRVDLVPRRQPPPEDEE